MLRNSVALVLVVHLLGETVAADWRQVGLRAHNEFRIAHGASPLVLDSKVKLLDTNIYLYVAPLCH